MLAATVLLALAVMSLALSTEAQTNTPLYLFINGSGSVSPYQNGDLLEVGQTYDMTATPDDGYIFTGWQQVDVFSDTEYTFDGSGGLKSNTSTIVAPSSPVYTNAPDLTFTMQPVIYLFNVPEVRMLSQTYGWQADFDPVPEPSSVALAGSAFATLTLLGAGRARKPRSYAEFYPNVVNHGRAALLRGRFPFIHANESHAPSPDKATLQVLSPSPLALDFPKHTATSEHNSHRRANGDEILFAEIFPPEDRF